MYRITTTDGSVTPREADIRFPNASAAAAYIAERYGWVAYMLSEPYCIGDEVYAQSVYETVDDCDADEEGAYAPRVVEVTR